MIVTWVEENVRRVDADKLKFSVTIAQEEVMADFDSHRIDDATRNAERRSAEAKPGSDRQPTAGEERAADAAMEELDKSGGLAETREHEEEMNELGANVEGEGRVA